MNNRSLVVAIFLLAAFPGTGACDAAGAAAETAGDGTRYITREERRESSRRYRPHERVALAALLELEHLDERTRDANGARRTHDASDATAELVLELDAGSAGLGEAAWEYDSETGNVRLDEAVWTFEPGAFEIELGRMFVPFGEYFSHFVSGPAIEFAETRGRALVLGVAIAPDVDISAYAWRGRSRPLRGQRDLNWGVNAEAALAGSLTIGAGYLSNLADGDWRPLEDEGDRYVRRVGGVNAYLAGELKGTELTLEYVAALAALPELDAANDHPESVNLEFARGLGPALSLALRVERSREVEDAPATRVGIALGWQFLPRAYLTVEHLRGRFRAGADEDEGAAAERIASWAVQISISP